MPFYLIRNNFKLMFRSKWCMILMTIGPIITTALLTSAFTNMMKSYDGLEEFTVGYYMDDHSLFAPFMETIKEAGAEAGITFHEFYSDDAKGIMEKNECRSFIEFIEDGYIVFKLDGYEIEGITTEYFLNRLVTSMEEMSMGEIQKADIPVKNLEIMPDIEAKDYYGVVYVVYFMWCCIVSFSAVVTEEKKHGIGKKFEVTPVSDWGFYLAKVIPCVLVTGCETVVSVMIITYMNDLHWGNIPGTILIMGLNIIAAATFGVLMIDIFQHLALAVAATFTIAWTAGLVGGTFESYLFSSWSESIRRISPLYHINRTLVEYGSRGSSEYAKSCILYLIIMSIVCIVGGLMIEKYRKGKAA